MTLHSLDDLRMQRLNEIAKRAIQIELEHGPERASVWMHHECSLLADPECVRARMIELMTQYRQRAGL